MLADVDWSAVRDFVLTLPLSFASLLVLAWLAARLLGTRQRSWLSAVIAASTGVLFGGVLLSTASRNPELETVNAGVIIVTQILATMAATVVLDLFSDRPFEHRPVVRIPHPARDARAAVRRARRYVHVLRIASRRGLAPYLGLHGDPENAVVAASSVREAMEEAGGVFVKLGQLLAGRADLLPAEVRREFSRLQEQVAPAEPAAVKGLVETELGAPLDEVFATFDLEPLAAASIGQAHAATLRDGTDVIVKVQRPGIDAAVDDDLAITRWLAHMAERRTAWGRSYGVAALAEEFGNGLREELDFRAEARNIREATLALADQPGVVVPHVYPELSTRRVLVLERVTGDALSDLVGEPLTEDARKLGDALLRAIVAPMMAGERFHADPHPGNVRLLPDGNLALLDFGATGRLDTFEQASVTDILLAIHGRDPSLLLDAIRHVAIVRREVDERQLEHALAHFLARHISPAAKPDASMLTELLRVFLTFGIALPAGTTTMFRALVTLQGTLECLCPEYPVIDAAQELASTLVMGRIEPSTLAAAAQKEVVTALPLLRRVPRHLDRIATQLESGDLRFQARLFADPDDAHVLGRLVGQVVLVLAAATAGGLAIGLLTITGGPDVTAGLSLHRALGYAALMLAVVLLLRAITTVLRESR